MYVIMGENARPRRQFNNQIVISKKQFNTVLQQFSFYSPSLCFSDPFLMEGLSHYIEFSKPSPSYSCSSSNPAFKYVSYQTFSLILCERQWLRPLFRGLLHINAARKVAAVYLMRWWQLFPKIFPYSYLLRTCLKSILIVGVSWKITQVTRMLTRLIFVRFEEGNLLGPQPSTLSLRNYLLWGLRSHLPLLERIPISKQGLRPNIKIQAFAPTIALQNFDFSLLPEEKKQNFDLPM